MGSSYADERLEKREIGELLELLGRQLLLESDVSFRDLENFFEKLRARRGLLNRYPDYNVDNLLDSVIRFTEQLKSSDNIRDFLEVSYNIPVPYKLGRSILAKLAVGVVLTSKTNLDEIKLRWEKREKRIDSINPYQMPKEQFEAALLDNALFPSGYSVISFAKKYRIRLPVTNDKKTLIAHLMDQLFERPSDSKRIGDWGLDKKKVRQ